MREDWPLVRLASVVQFIGGGTPSRSDSSYYRGAIPWVTPKDMKVPEIFESQDKITETAVAESSARMIPADSVLLVVRSGVLKHTLPVCIARVPLAINQDIKALVCSAELDPAFLRHCLRAKSRTILSWVRATTADNLPVARLHALEIPLPPLPEQRRIAAILDQADAIRRKRQESLDLLDELLAGGYRALLGPGAPGYASWPESRISELAHPSKGSIRTGPFGSALRHSEFVDSGIAVLGIDNAVRNRFAWGERRYISEAKYDGLRRYTVRPGDVIITIMGTTGRSAVVPEDVPLAISTKHLAVITVDRARIEPLFLSHAIHSDPIVLAQMASETRGAIMAGLNLEIIKRLRLRVPPVDVQQCFAAIVRHIDQTRVELRASFGESVRLCESLFQRAFRAGL